MTASPFLTKPETQARIHKYLKRAISLTKAGPLANPEDGLERLEEIREQTLMIGGLLLLAQMEEEDEYIRTHPKRKTIPVGTKERLA